MKCEYRDICKHYRRDSWYCNKAGGSGCGTYRWHENEKARIKEYMRDYMFIIWTMLVFSTALNIWMFFLIFFK